MQRMFVGIPGFCMHASAQLALPSALPHSAKIPPASGLQSSPAREFPEDESFTALGGPQYHLFLLPGLWDQKCLFHPTTNFQRQKVTPTDQVWIAVWQCRSLHPGYESGRSFSYLVLLCCINFQEQKWLYHFEKKELRHAKLLAIAAATPECRPAPVFPKEIFKTDWASLRDAEHTGAACREREPCFLETAKAWGMLEGALGKFCLWTLPGNCFSWDMISYF